MIIRRINGRGALVELAHSECVILHSLLEHSFPADAKLARDVGYLCVYFARVKDEIEAVGALPILCSSEKNRVKRWVAVPAANGDYEEVL